MTGSIQVNSSELGSALRFFAGVVACAMVIVCHAGSSAGQDDPSAEEIGPVRVLRSDAEAIQEIFGAVDSLTCDTLDVTGSMRTALAESLQREIHDSVYVVYKVYAGGGLRGFGVVADERGKYRPITFMAGIDPALQVVDVRVLVYRENRGGEVERTRFLRQYRGKTLDDPIRINRDIINITGATISVRALNAGVRKALAVAQLLTGRESGQGDVQ